MVVLAEGRVRQVGPVLDVFRRPADLVVARSVGVESVIPARIAGADDGLVLLKVGDATIRAVDLEIDRDHPEVFACIRAEEVVLQRAGPSSVSARNHWPGRIVSVESEGPIERVIVDCGFPLVALITRQAREEMSLAAGVPVVAAVKATAVHLVARS